MPRSLTAENGAKALLSGEFFVEIREPYYCDCGDEDCEACELTETDSLTATRQVPVPWATIKEIYAKAVEHLKQELADHGEQARQVQHAQGRGQATRDSHSSKGET